MARRAQSVAIVLALALALAAGAAQAEPQLRFKASLSGAQENPEVVSSTTGTTKVKFDDGLTRVNVNVTVRDGVQVVAAHIHCAAAGVNGSIVVDLFGSTPADVDGRLVKADFTNADVNAIEPDEVCTAGVNNIASLLAALRAGLLYVNVHTVANPSGEIRGQLFAD